MNKTELLIKLVAATIWIISGIVVVFPLPGVTLQSQWAFGVFFGMLYIPMLNLTVPAIFRFMYRRSSRIKRFVDKHWGVPE